MSADEGEPFELDGIGERVGSKVPDPNAPPPHVIEHRDAERARIDRQREAGDPDEVAAILAKGRRRFPAPDVLALHTAHARALRSAWMEGTRYGSQGFLTGDDPMVRHAWERSDAYRHLLGNPPALPVIGLRALCDDPAAAVISVWTIAAVHGDRVWLAANERGRDRIDLLVPASSVRLITGGRIAEEPF